MARRDEREPPVVCDRCRVPNRGQRRYCYNCGAELPPRKPSPTSILRVPSQLEVVVLVGAIAFGLILAGVLLVVTRAGLGAG